MTNPFSLGSILNMPSLANLNGLGDGEAKSLGKIDLSGELQHDVIIPPIEFVTGAAGWAAGDVCTLYLLQTDDETVWTDGIDGDSLVDESAKIITAQHIQTVKAGAVDTTYRFDRFTLRELGLVTMPGFVAILFKNGAVAAGADLAAAGHDARYQIVSYT